MRFRVEQALQLHVLNSLIDHLLLDDGIADHKVVVRGLRQQKDQLKSSNSWTIRCQWQTFNWILTGLLKFLLDPSQWLASSVTPSSTPSCFEDQLWLYWCDFDRKKFVDINSNSWQQLDNNIYTMGLLDHSFKGDILICCFDFGIISNFQGLLTCPSRLELILLGTEVSPRGPSKTRPE